MQKYALKRDMRAPRKIRRRLRKFRPSRRSIRCGSGPEFQSLARDGDNFRDAKADRIAKEPERDRHSIVSGG